jgi:predicted transposase YdaD
VAGRGRTKGPKEGREEGREEGHHEVVLYILNRRFDSVPEDLTLRIKKLALEHLLTLLDAVQTTESLSAVEAALDEIEDSISTSE